MKSWPKTEVPPVVGEARVNGGDFWVILMSLSDQSKYNSRWLPAIPIAFWLFSLLWCFPFSPLKVKLLAGHLRTAQNCGTHFIPAIGLTRRACPLCASTIPLSRTSNAKSVLDIVLREKYWGTSRMVLRKGLIRLKLRGSHYSFEICHLLEVCFRVRTLSCKVVQHREGL